MCTMWPGESCLDDLRVGSCDCEVAGEMQYVAGDTGGGYTCKWKLNQPEREAVTVSGRRLTGDTQARKRSFCCPNQLNILKSFPLPLKMLKGNPKSLLEGDSVQSHLDTEKEKPEE